jgi:GTP-binding protein EngB required for normal cell division
MNWFGYRRVTLEKAQAAWQKMTDEQLETRAILTADTEVMLVPFPFSFDD